MRQNPRADELAARLDLHFEDLKDLEAALAHRSWCAENPGTESNERLEFLGDAVLGLVITTHIFRTYPTFPEGELAKIRASVVSSVSLAEAAAGMELGPHLLLGKGEDQSGGREKRSILADSLEAVIGAVYLSSGLEDAERLIMSFLGERIVEGAAGPGGHDYKTRLQEHAARNLDFVPRYAIVDHGPDHAKRFLATVLIGEEVLGEGEGKSKKQAEQSAAQAAWESIGRSTATLVDGDVIADRTSDTTA